ncbi:MAG: DNA helicase RecQ [Methylobacteriaceae bacterium]|nr:DNA helicase RecQ [Methylobacteriaceae bacterium]MBV9703541.1 DNA helicase RecQ [Methylobacteriaceae bacterium]
MERGVPPQARAILKSVFGYDDFRPGQEEVIAAVLAGENVLAVMPTGSGKSMCYQLPAATDGGLTVIVSPLIALMRDQVRQMTTLGVAAATLNSLNSEAENRAAWMQLATGELRLLFISPERLLAEGLAERLGRANLKRFAIDEAHCVSQWGHDFRPEYRELRRAAEMMGVSQTIALTATADRVTRGDIAERLFTTSPRVFVHSFDRPNLFLNFDVKHRPRRQLQEFLDRHRDESGIVYCGTRDKTEALADYFSGQDHVALPYHAGLDQEVRHRNADRFLQEDGIIVVATIAFGMGINKPDIRFVAHADMPDSVEAYYQEIGRAGRDGLPADTLTLYGLDDMAFRRRQIDAKDIGDARRRLEHRRLDAMIALCEAPACRRQTLLAHFDEASDPCGHCDLCTGGVSLYDGTIDAQKVLSAVARTGQRFGAGYLINVLRGEATDAICRNQHDAIKTFGVGRDRNKRAWGAIIRQLFAAQALAIASDEHGGFCLTEKGDAIMRGREPIRLRADVLAVADPSFRRLVPVRSVAPADAGAATVLAKLKRTRLELARAESVPAFVIFADRTLIEMAEKLPANAEEMRRISGVGEVKLRRYGKAFLAAIQAARPKPA